MSAGNKLTALQVAELRFPRKVVSPKSTYEEHMRAHPNAGPKKVYIKPKPSTSNGTPGEKLKKPVHRFKKGTRGCSSGKLSRLLNRASGAGEIQGVFGDPSLEKKCVGEKVAARQQINKEYSAGRKARDKRSQKEFIRRRKLEQVAAINDAKTN